MIPPQLPPDCRSPGERMLFHRFRTEPGMEDWIVLHSLGVARHPKRFEGEIDFVVIVPGSGVLCLEVKSGYVAREDGLWKYGVPHQQITSSVGPFRQAAEAMYAIRKYISANAPTLSNILFYSAALFTYIDFDQVSPEWHPWQVVDRGLLVRRPLSNICQSILAAAHQYTATCRSARWYSPEHSCPTHSQVKKIADVLRGDFEYPVPLRLAVDAANSEMQRFTEEQFFGLDVLEENRRVLFHGPAGTGKTYLALEATRRYANSGCRTLLICYNRMLGRWLESQMEVDQKRSESRLTVSHFHKLLHTLAPPDRVEFERSDYWSEILPDRVASLILEGKVPGGQYEAIVADEAQDLLTQNYLDVLDLLLEGGLAGGKWAFFGDFERQAIYTCPVEENCGSGREALSTRAPFHFRFPLYVNCRNTASIATGIELAGQLNPGYSRVLSTDSDSDIEAMFYRDESQQSEILQTCLRKRLQTYNADEIRILSSRRNDMACAARVQASVVGIHLVPLRDEAVQGGAIGYTSIHAFKGMEANAVILTDIEELDSDSARDLLYVGMSRARTNLTVLMKASCKLQWLDLIRKGLAARSKENTEK
jgi:hypothetical protein